MNPSQFPIGSVIEWNDRTPHKPDMRRGIVIGYAEPCGRQCLTVEMIGRKGQSLHKVRRVYATHGPKGVAK